MTEFFYLEHSKKYQGKVDGKDRIKMNMMWVPAAVITEEMEEEESKVVQAEARYRLKKKKGILVFSRPERLKDWLEENDIDFDEVKHLIIDAGKTVPGFTQKDHGVEFFVHSPFVKPQNDNEEEVRNDDALVVPAAFLVGGAETSLQLFADINHEVIAAIVKVTNNHGNEGRRAWDIFKLSHHCSYLSLGPERGDEKTEPVDEVAWLFEEQGRRGCTVVSTSKPIPAKGSEEDKSTQPPHRQAANYYRDLVNDKDGEFIVTMEHPKESDPRPLVIDITGQGYKVKMPQVVGAAAVMSVNAPRAG
jgi:hypothetical protein